MIVKRTSTGIASIFFLISLSQQMTTQYNELKECEPSSCKAPLQAFCCLQKTPWSKKCPENDGKSCKKIEVSVLN